LGSLVGEVAVGAAVIFDPADIQMKVEKSDQTLLVTPPTKYFKVWITSANDREPEMNTFAAFERHVNALAALHVGPARAPSTVPLPETRK
jgi:hypothetical protein